MQPQEMQCKYFNLSFIIICEILKKSVKVTGIYIPEYIFKSKPVIEEDEENKHIHPNNKKVVRYLGYYFNHNFLYSKCLELNQGVTYDLINGTSVHQQGNTGENVGQENQQQKRIKPPVEQIQFKILKKKKKDF